MITLKFDIFICPYLFNLLTYYLPNKTMTLTYSFKKKVYLFLREREHTSQGGAEREGDRGSEAGSALTADSPTWGSNSETVRS